MLVANLPTESATWGRVNDLPAGWSLAELLLADVFHAMNGEPHPMRPRSSAREDAKRAARLRARLKAQRDRLKEGPDG